MSPRFLVTLSRISDHRTDARIEIDGGIERGLALVGTLSCTPETAIAIADRLTTPSEETPLVGLLAESIAQVQEAKGIAQ